jgi:hypothetical protein
VADTQVARPGRNERCHCGSGRKYKQCCLAKDEAADREARAAVASEESPDAPAGAEEPHHVAPSTPRRKATAQPWKRGAQNARQFQRFSTPRKVGG